MKSRYIFLICMLLLLGGNMVHSQDNRTIETKVTDLLALMPVNDLARNDKLMAEMSAFGDEGLKLVCSRVIPAGTGDDTKARFAIESYSRFLSQKGMERDKLKWESICISGATDNSDPGVKDFFIKQLQVIGGEATAEALKNLLHDQQNCFPAVSAIAAVGGPAAEKVFVEALADHGLPCAASVMNALAAMGSLLAVNEYIYWCSSTNVNTKAAAYNALAVSGSPQAYKILSSAAKSYSYRWERTGATAALLKYAEVAGKNGDAAALDKICKLLIKKCNDKLNYQNKTAAIKLYTSFHGADAMPLVLKAAAHTDKKYRDAAINSTLEIKGEEITATWISFFPKASPGTQASLITMLGVRGDKTAVPLVKEALKNPDLAVRAEASEAYAALAGKEAAPALIEYMTEFTGQDDQMAATEALKTVSGNQEIALVAGILKNAPSEAVVSAINLLSWNADKKYFNMVLPFASSDNKAIKEAALTALANLAGPDDTDKLLVLLSANDDAGNIKLLQNAVVASIAQGEKPAEAESILIKAANTSSMKERIIPVLASTGGKAALDLVLKEFENGSPEMREVCFTALTTWKDYTATSALLEICASGNKSYEDRAFSTYVRLVRTAPLNDDEKLGLLKKITPYALSTQRKNSIMSEAGRIKSYNSLYFVESYLSDPETAPSAALAAMNIALPSVTGNAGMHGARVRAILSKAMNELKGQESEYNREMINKYLQSMPSDEGSATEYKLTPGEAKEGFMVLFNGMNLDGWVGNKQSYVAEDGMIVIKPGEGSGGNLYTEKEYSDFIFRFEFLLTPDANNGLGIRAPLEGDAAYVGMELQILDNTAPVYAALQPYQYHGSVYGVIPAKRDFLKPVGEWNYQEVWIKGTKIRITLNGTVIVDGDIAGPRDNGTMDKRDHPGLKNTKGHIGFLGHGSVVKFRNIRIREL